MFRLYFEGRSTILQPNDIIECHYRNGYVLLKRNELPLLVTYTAGNITYCNTVVPFEFKGRQFEMFLRALPQQPLLFFTRREGDYNEKWLPTFRTYLVQTLSDSQPPTSA